MQNLKSRIKKLEDVILEDNINVEVHGITLDEWIRMRKGEDILSELPGHRRETFLKWLEKAEQRNREVEKTLSKFKVKSK